MFIHFRLSLNVNIAADQLIKENKLNMTNSNVRSSVSALGLYNSKKLSDPIASANKKIIMFKVLAFIILCCEFDSSRIKKKDHLKDR